MFVHVSVLTAERLEKPKERLLYFVRRQSSCSVISIPQTLLLLQHFAWLIFLFTPMTKKSSKKTPSQLQENGVTEEEKPTSTHQKAGNEIDEIFAGKKRKKYETEKIGKLGEVTKKIDKTKKKKKKNVKRKADGADDGEFADPPSRPRNKTVDGFSVYTEEELGINNADGGNTPLCPFDCSCCF
ncbi:hypothetical protein Fmac_031808 [Flemingia macrophylla]|uniref:DUF1764 domain-containing protein n=1 Tax=Flemingia macrophylla TaxID=520843 RepID=A0ABD1L338_9FABA